jgi:hypothetical protein
MDQIRKPATGRFFHDKGMPVEVSKQVLDALQHMHRLLRERSGQGSACQL